MQEDLTIQLLTILRRVTILSPASVSFAGKILSFAESDLPNHHERQDGKSMIQHLGRLLYLNCYCRTCNEVITTEVITPSPDLEFMKRLSTANAGREHLDRGWRMLYQLPTGHYVAEKNGFTRTLFPGEFISHSDFRGPVREGTNISIFCPRESKTMHPGFYFVFGETITDEQDDTHQLRFYWNINSSGAESLVRLLTQRLNHFQLPFRLKILNDPAAFNRSDAAVLYLHKRFYRLTSELLKDIHKQLFHLLKVGTPLFTKQLTTGLGLAEEPTTGESFGQQRCRILAQAIWRAYELRHQKDHEQLIEVSKHFEMNGINLDFPHLNPGSTEDYVL